jgi:amino-acid N-acetyltransferase
MNIVPASQNSFTAAIRLLQTCGLPTEDITPGTQLFVAEEDNEVIATVAVEYDYSNALLRSLCVDKHYRKKGIGEDLVSFIEDYVARQGVQNIYILTTTAENFFTKRGYQKDKRTEVPFFIQNTSEFSSLCSSSAVLMKKSIS